MTDRERLIELLKEEKCFARYMTDDERREILADYLLSNGVVVLPCKVEDIIDKIISHNEDIALWHKTEERNSKLLWRGMAHEIPDEHKTSLFKRIFGTVPETIAEADTVNILVETERALEGAGLNE